MEYDVTKVYMENPVVIASQFTMEDIVCQLQQNVRNILCVKDGYELFVFRSHNMIPPNLRFGAIHINPVTDQAQYYFYSNNDEEECYCFFLRSIYEWLISGRQVPYQGVRSLPPVQNEQNTSQDSGIELSELVGTELTVDTLIDDTDAHKDVFSYQVRR